MKLSSIKVFFLSLVALGFSSCGGGGGSGGGSSADTTGVRFIHAALEASPRQIVVDGVSVTEFVTFANSSGFKKVGSGVKNITLLGRSGDTEAVPPLEISDDDRTDIVLFQGPDSARAVAFKHPAFDGRGVRFLNAVRSIDGGVAAAAINGVSTPFGSASTYLTATQEIFISINGGEQKITLPADGRLFTLVGVGESGYLTRIIVLKDE